LFCYYVYFAITLDVCFSVYHWPASEDISLPYVPTLPVLTGNVGT